MREPEEEAKLQEGEDFVYEEDVQLQQEFINLDEYLSSDYAQISCFVLSKDKRMVCAGTMQVNAKILVWDLCSRTSLKSITLTNTNHIENVRFAYDNRHILVQAILHDYTTMLYLMDWQTTQLLGCANLQFSVPFKIRDLEMYPNSLFQFVTCGMQHMAVWQLRGDKLEYQNMEIEYPEDVAEKMDESSQELRVDFMTLIFVNETIISGGNDGYLYVWDFNKIVKQQNAHPKSQVLSLYTTLGSNMFVSGGKDGKVVIWELGSQEYSYILEKFYEYDIKLTRPMEVPDSPEFHIQSVCIGNKYILAGNR